MQKSPTYSIRLSENDKKSLRLLAQLTGKNQADTVRHLVREQLEKLQAHPGQALTSNERG